MKKIKKEIILQELTPKGMMAIKGGDHSHDLIAPVNTESYGTGGPPPLRDGGEESNS